MPFRPLARTGFVTFHIIFVVSAPEARRGGLALLCCRLVPKSETVELVEVETGNFGVHSLWRQQLWRRYRWVRHGEVNACPMQITSVDHHREHFYHSVISAFSSARPSK